MHTYEYYTTCVRHCPVLCFQSTLHNNVYSQSQTLTDKKKTKKNERLHNNVL